MHLSVRFKILSFLIFLFTSIAYSQEQVTQIEGPDCCYNIVDIKDMDGRIFALATDYRGAARLYKEIRGHYVLYMENIPEGQREVAHQGFGEDGDYYFVLYQNEVHFYYPLKDEWKFYELPEHGVYSQLPDWYYCHSTLQVSEHGVIDWKTSEWPDNEADLIFHDIRNNEEVPFFKGKYFSSHCPQIYQIDDYILASTRSDSNIAQVVSYHIPTQTEQVLLELDDFTNIQKMNGKFALTSGLQCFITNGNPDSTFKLQHAVTDASFVDIQRLSSRWELIFSFDTREVYTRQYSLQGEFIQDEWINYFTPISSDPFRVHNIERTAYDKYIITLWYNSSIYVLDLITQSLTLIENTESLYNPKEYFLIGPYFITYDGENYYDKKIQTYHLNTSKYKSYNATEIAQLNRMKLINDKLYLIADNIFGDLLIEDEIIDYMGTLFSFQIGNGWKQELKLSDNNYGLIYGRLEATDNGYFLIGSGQIFKYNNGDFDKIFEAGQILDWMSTENGQYFISTDTAYQRDLSEIELYHIPNNGNLQHLGEFQSRLNSFNRYGLQLIPTGMESHQILMNYSIFRDGRISYFDLPMQEIVDLRTPVSNQRLKFLEVKNNKLIGHAGNSYWEYDPQTYEFTHLFDIPNMGPANHYKFYSTEEYYLNFYRSGDTLSLYSTNKSSLLSEKILDVQGYYGGLEILKDCGQSFLFSFGWEEEVLFVSDGTRTGSRQIEQWPELESISPASDYDLPYFNVKAATSGLYFWNCARDTFEKAHDSLIMLQYPFTFEGEQWIVGKDSKGLTATIENDHSIQVQGRLHANIGHERKATRLLDLYAEKHVKQIKPNQAIFQGNFNGDGPELWAFHSDSGLYQVADINPGAYGSMPYDLTIIEDHLYFLAYTYEDGMQVWRMHIDSVGSTSVSKPFQEIDFSFGPNPTENQLHLNELPIKSCEILLMDPSGKILQHKQKQFGTKEHTLQLHGYAPGLYIIKVLESGTRVGTLKVIKI